MLERLVRSSRGTGAVAGGSQRTRRRLARASSPARSALACHPPEERQRQRLRDGTHTLLYYAYGFQL